MKKNFVYGTIAFVVLEILALIFGPKDGWDFLITIALMVIIAIGYMFFLVRFLIIAFKEKGMPNFLKIVSIILIVILLVVTAPWFNFLFIEPIVDRYNEGMEKEKAEKIWNRLEVYADTSDIEDSSIPSYKYNKHVFKVYENNLINDVYDLIYKQPYSSKQTIFDENYKVYKYNDFYVLFDIYESMFLTRDFYVGGECYSLYGDKKTFDKAIESGKLVRVK